MDTKKIIEILENESCSECTWGCETPFDCANPNCEYIKAIKGAIKKLIKYDEYRTPKKMVHLVGKSGIYCPTCHKYVHTFTEVEDINSLSNWELYAGKTGRYERVDVTHSYCANCGQALDPDEEDLETVFCLEEKEEKKKKEKPQKVHCGDCLFSRDLSKEEKEYGIGAEMRCTKLRKYVNNKPRVCENYIGRIK